MKYSEKVFGPFQRLHTEEEFKGNGIGLSTVQRIVHRHGGVIWTEAQLGVGATFYFTLKPYVHQYKTDQLKRSTASPSAIYTP